LKSFLDTQTVLAYYNRDALRKRSIPLAKFVYEFIKFNSTRHILDDLFSQSYYKNIIEFGSNYPSIMRMLKNCQFTQLFQQLKVRYARWRLALVPRDLTFGNQLLFQTFTKTEHVDIFLAGL
jgi:hypothetical protein